MFLMPTKTSEDKYLFSVFFSRFLEIHFQLVNAGSKFPRFIQLILKKGLFFASLCSGVRRVITEHTYTHVRDSKSSKRSREAINDAFSDTSNEIVSCWFWICSRDLSIMSFSLAVNC